MSRQTPEQTPVRFPGSIRVEDVRPAPLLFVQDPTDYDEQGPTGWEDPWCVSCGARVADGLGVEAHTRFHGWEPSNHRLVSSVELSRLTRGES